MKPFIASGVITAPTAPTTAPATTTPTTTTTTEEIPPFEPAVFDIPDLPTPLTAIPDAPVPLAGDLMTIADEPVPLGDLVTIVDENVPLGVLPISGGTVRLNMAVTASLPEDIRRKKIVKIVNRV
jgi:hypothetical protein